MENQADSGYALSFFQTEPHKLAGLTRSPFSLESEMELDRDAPLFSCSLPVVLRSAPPPPPFVGSSSEQQHYGHQLTTSITCEDRKVELTARVMMSRPCHAMTTSVLHLELTDEQDPCFFYTMQVALDDE